MNLKQTFKALCLEYSADSKLIESFWNEIETHYSSSNRHYHNLLHLEYIIYELMATKDQINNWNAILFAVFYHDIIYKATSKKNEELSAELARKKLTELNVPDNEITLCFDAIIATKHHEINENNDINLFTDADLAILGSPINIYKKYIQNIRKEYSIFPDFLYNKGRKKVLKHFMEMKSIYKTISFKEKYEKQARENLTAEITSY